MNRLKEIRKELRLTQSDLAKVLNVTKNTYSRYEREVHKMDQDILTRLSKHLNLSIDYILGNIDVPLTIAEENLNNTVDHMTDMEVLGKYNLELDGKPLTEKEAKKILKFIRALNSEEE